ncbi:putative N-succinyldiaminopimelate aminotransferase DapC [Clostridiales bacterium]|nr:putative N-succinyldiaminopimelate aminotransferase DapC [Clostridiales bacterium]
MLEAAFKQKPKAIIVCNPSNPCGKVFTIDELKVIADFAQKYDSFVITDEVYEHIVYKPNKHIFFASLPGMYERTITCGSLSKTYSVTGWRIGHILAPENIISVAKKVHDFLTVGAAHPLMEASVTGLELGDDYYEDFLNMYQSKKDIFVKGLKELGLNYTDPQGAYFVLMNTAEFGVTDDRKFCEWMAQNVGVGAVPGSSFFHGGVKNYIRFHFAKNDETLYEAINRLETLKKKASLAKGSF